MDIHFQETVVPVYRELARIAKSVPVAMESVVPDTKEDIGRILSVLPEIYLKGKEIRTHGVYAEFEVLATVLYVNDKEDAVRHFKISQPVKLEYELPAAEESSSIHLNLTGASAQARAVNPRKVSVDLEIGLEILLSREDTIVISQSLPENCSAPVHILEREAAVTLPSCVCEKILSVNEQLVFSSDAKRPSELICWKTTYRVRDREAVGGRLLVKGQAELTVDYEPEGSEIPCRKTFSVPFSQLIDLGEAEADDAELWIVPTSDYLELIDTIDGQKLLCAELHAVTQVRSRKKQSIRYIIDAYSNRMPCECHTADFSMTEQIKRSSFSMSGKETIELPEGTEELISVYPAVNSPSPAHSAVVLDLLCRSRDGTLSVMRRTVALEADAEAPENAAILPLALEEPSIRAEGRDLSVQLRAEGELNEQKQISLQCVTSLSLDEEGLIDEASYPSLTAVWAETESVWELAKQYHSSPEAIEAWNGGVNSNPIFIPKTE